MPRNPAGTAYSTPNVFSPLAGTGAISSGQVDANFTDVGTELVNSLPRDGRAAMTGQLKIVNGSEELPGLAFASDPDTGFRWSGANEFRMVVGGSDVATITSDGMTLEKPEVLLAIGDFFDTTRTLDARFLRRNGALYDIADYPDLAALLPELDDGVIWENVSAGVASGSIKGITQGPDRYVALNSSGSDTNVLASIDGGAWSIRATLTGFSAEGIAYDGNIYIAFDGNGKFSISSDGDVWSTPATVAAGTIGLTGAAYGNGMFVVVGLNGANKAIWSSPDGSVWTDRSTGTGTGLFQGVRFYNGNFIAVGSNGAIYTSTNGTSWTARTSGVTVSLRGVAYYSGVYVVVGSSGTILTSNNLAGWTPRTSGTTAQLNAAWGNSLGFIVVGASGVARISDTSAVTWIAAPTGVTSTLFDVIADSVNEERYIAAGLSTNFLYGIRTAADQFRVPNDNPTYGWIKALDELP